MAELIPAPFGDLVTRLYEEPQRQSALFELPRRCWYSPSAEGPDLSVSFHGHRAGNPSGPASGPHTQMAQNLLLAYVAGARIMELKTVQQNDRLDIPRPCIDMANVGYNVEWSQELLVEESLREYVAGRMLIELFRHAHTEAPATLAGRAGDVVFDISLGYDLAGITSNKIQRFLDGIRDARAMVDRLRSEIPTRHVRGRDLPFPTTISSSLTLSTFHGCPTDEIERIAEFLIAERGLDVIVKMNPPTIGQGELEHLLHDVLGYREIRVRPQAYAASQTFEEAVQMTRRLTDFASSRGRSFGCKFSNTLEVENHRQVFGAGNALMYLSGAPLHVITMSLAARFRQSVGAHVPISFSAGIDARNFASAVACGFVPVTTCTDLLKTGGYGRLPDYLQNLAKEMEAVGAGSIDDFVRKAHGHGGDVASAALANNTVVAMQAQENPRYRADNNRREPKRVDTHLRLFDCLTCDKCIPVCPNAANFVYPVAPVDVEFENVAVHPDGSLTGAGKGRFTIARKHQIANYGEFCNECGNCDTFCPELGGPYIEKPTFHRTAKAYIAAAPRDGFVVAREGTFSSITGRIKGREHKLVLGDAGTAIYADGAVEAQLSGDALRVTSARLLQGSEPVVVNLETVHALRAMLLGILDTARVNELNVAMLH